MQNPQNSRFNTRTMVTMAMLAALAVMLIWLVHFPIIPAAPFLEYDPGNIPVLISTFAFGPLAGLIVTVVAAVVQGFTVSQQSGPYGILMHIIASGTYVVVAGLIYRANKTRKGACIALACGALSMTIAMVIANLFITPLFLGGTMKDVIPLLLPAIVPFNLIKAGINGVVVFLIYKPISKVIHRKS